MLSRQLTLRLLIVTIFCCVWSAVSVANSVDPDQTVLVGAVWSGSIPFVCMPKLVLDISIYMQQTTSATIFSDTLFCTRQRANNKGLDQTAQMYMLICNFFVFSYNKNFSHKINHFIHTWNFWVFFSLCFLFLFFTCFFWVHLSYHRRRGKCNRYRGLKVYIQYTSSVFGTT